MTTLVDFAPSPLAPFQFTPTLDGSQYTVQIAWNLSGQRWYINIYTLQGTLVWAQAMVGSPPNYDIDLAPTFASVLLFRAASQQFEITP